MPPSLALAGARNVSAPPPGRPSKKRASISLPPAAAATATEEAMPSSSCPSTDDAFDDLDGPAESSEVARRLRRASEMRRTDRRVGTMMDPKSDFESLRPSSARRGERRRSARFSSPPPARQRREEGEGGEATNGEGGAIPHRRVPASACGSNYPSEIMKSLRQVNRSGRELTAGERDDRPEDEEEEEEDEDRPLVVPASPASDVADPSSREAPGPTTSAKYSNAWGRRLVDSIKSHRRGAKSATERRTDLRSAVRSSKTCEDLREGGADELGWIRVEVLECRGLPKLDRIGNTDAYCFVVCGSRAFVTDVVPDTTNPVWLPLHRRACLFPLHNAYSKVFIGVFDYDGEWERDDFAGRVVINVPRLRAGCEYDVILPLRQTSHVYTHDRSGSIRLRLHLEWDSERRALLSYLPRSVADVTGRLTGPGEAVTVACPDGKSFYNIALTVYGTDFPGRYNSHMRTATTMEIRLIRTALTCYAKQMAWDIYAWKNPALSAYFFVAWIHFVVTNSVRHASAFVVSLALLLLLKNYVRCNASGLAQGALLANRSLWDIAQILLFDKVDQGELRGGDLPMPEQMLRRIFGTPLLTGVNAHDSWRYMDNAEFPFSIGSLHPKMTTGENLLQALMLLMLLCGLPCTNKLPRLCFMKSLAEASASAVGDAMVEAECDDYEENDDSFERSPGKRSIVGMRKSLKERMSLQRSLSDSAGRIKSRNSSGTLLRKSTFKRKSFEITPDRRNSIGGSSFENQNAMAATVARTNDNLMWFPNQNVRYQAKSEPIQQQAWRQHRKAQRATLHLFDDRVFIAEDPGKAERLLRINASSNPIAKRLNPLLASVVKIFSIGLSSFRAIFNVFMWKDPNLSFFFLLFLLCSMVVILVFPWKPFFLLVGIIGLGPQNKLLVSWYLNNERKRKLLSTRTKRRQSIVEKVMDRIIQRYDPLTDLADSPLLMRNNMQRKADGELHHVIIPSVPFLYDRFYDWPPDPSSSCVKCKSNA
ncbi:hypothetical protein ACHAWF_014351 [Thalassiosira exigua]